MNNLRGKTAIITGASNGIGKAIAIQYGEMGVNLILMGRKIEALTQLKEYIESRNSVKVHVIAVDIRDFSKLETSINEIPEEFSKIDILVNNAGLALGLEKVFTNSVEEIDNVIDTDVKGVLYMTRLIVPKMLEQGIPGHIVNMGSVAGNAAYAGGAVYCGAKAAVKTISDGLRIDLVDTKIRVTTILPGMVETDFSLVRFRGDKSRADSVYKGIEALTPEDVAGTVVYVTNLPGNIQITDLTLTPVNQADGRTVHKVL